ncbi:MAG: hypothetical protein DSM106950_40175 [Stigonema ocellatum SAG 48.90 = DSM 106950]|nr:hypothetical protein [Stigonema ocellatum SAG 48.90 = DSM 106950]
MNETDSVDHKLFFKGRSLAWVRASIAAFIRMKYRFICVHPRTLREAALGASTSAVS